MDPITKQFVRKCIADDQSSLSWGLQRLRAYLRELKAQSGAEEIQVSGPKHELSEIASEWIEDYDPELLLFSSYHRDFEISRAKATGIFRMPKRIIEAEDNLRKRLQPVSYKFGDALFAQSATDGIQVVETRHEESRVSVVLGEIVRTSITVPFEENDLPRLWPPLEQAAMGKMQEASRLEKCSLTLQVDTRTITNVNFDFSERIVELSTDTFRLRGPREEEFSDYAKRFRRAIDALTGNMSELDQVADQILMSSGITAPLARDFRMLRTSDRLALTVEIGKKHQDRDEMEEEVINRFHCQRKSVLVGKVTEYFREQKSFEGFLEAHKGHDPDRSARGHRHLQQLPSLSEDGCTCLVFYARSRGRSDTGRRGLGDKGELVVDCVKVKFDPRNGIVRGESKEDTTEQLDVVLTEIRKLLPGQPGFLG